LLGITVPRLLLGRVGELIECPSFFALHKVRSWALFGRCAMSELIP